MARGTRPPDATRTRVRARRWPLAALLGLVVAAGSAGVAMAQTTVPTQPTIPITPSTPVITTVRPTVAPTIKPTTTVTFRPPSTTAFRPPPTIPTTTVPLTTTTLATTTSSTEAPTTTTTAPTTTTTAAPAPAEPASSTGKLPFVVFGLLIVGAAIAVLTFLFWRHTRPAYDDFYDDDVSGPAPAIGRLDVLDDEDVAAPVSADGEPTVVVKPKSELQPAGARPGAGSGAGATGAAGSEVGLGAAGVGAAALAGGTLARRTATNDDGAADADDHGSAPTGTDGGEGSGHAVDDPTVFDDHPLESVVPVAAAAPVVARARDEVADEAEVEPAPAPAERWDDDEPATVAHDALGDVDEYEDVEAFGSDHGEVLVAPVAPRAPDAYEEPVYDESSGYDDDVEAVGYEHDVEDEHDVYEEALPSEELDAYDPDPPPFVDPAPPREMVSPSAVTILGPMRPGTGRDSDGDGEGVTLEPDPLEIVTLEDIERARSTRGRRPSGRGPSSNGNGSGRRG